MRVRDALDALANESDRPMTEKSAIQSTRGRGRPPQFARKVALDQAMRVFWDRGYDGATFDELVSAMSISPSSFYNTFGSKEGLYRAAIESYLGGPGGFFPAALAGGGTARDAFDRLIVATAAAYTDATNPAGCMISLAGVDDAPDRPEIRSLMRTLREQSRDLLKARLAEGIKAGELAADTDVAELAEFFETVFRGMAVRARDGAARDALLKTGRLAMNAWPQSAATSHLSDSF